MGRKKVAKPTVAKTAEERQAMRVHVTENIEFAKDFDHMIGRIQARFRRRIAALYDAIQVAVSDEDLQAVYDESRELLFEAPGFYNTYGISVDWPKHHGRKPTHKEICRRSAQGRGIATKSAKPKLPETEGPSVVKFPGKTHLEE